MAQHRAAMRIGGGAASRPGAREAASLAIPGRARCSARRRDARSRAALEDKDLTFNTTTVVENRPASADGVLRTLLLSVDDDVRQLSGRKFGSIPSLERLENPRWIDAFNQPGQYVIARNAEGAKERVVLASTPYDAHKDSAFLSASKVQILVDRNNTGGLNLGNLAPGDQFESSEVLGRGFQSLFHEEDRLGLSLEEGKNLVLVAGGTGIGPIRAVADWAPVQAYAGNGHVVSLFYHYESLESAAYVDEFQSWREAGIHVRPCQGKDASVIEGELFDQKGEVRSTIVKPDTDPSFLISGFPGKVTARLSRLLSNNGISGNRVFYCDF